jgi:hypothetical protein
MAAMPGSDVREAVPPSGMIGAGNANHFAVPNCMNRNAVTILRMLSRYGASVPQRLPRVQTSMAMTESSSLVSDAASLQ